VIFQLNVNFLCLRFASTRGNLHVTYPQVNSLLWQMQIWGLSSMSPKYLENQRSKANCASPAISESRANPSKVEKKMSSAANKRPESTSGETRFRAAAIIFQSFTINWGYSW